MQVVRTSESVPSSPPRNVKCTSLSSTSLKITWDKLSPDSINGVLLGYKVHYTLAIVPPGASEQTKTEVTRDQNRLILYGLQKYSNYSIQVLGYTKVGDGVSSEVVFCKTQEDVPSAPSAIKAAVSSPESIIISWLPPLNPNGIVRSYTIYRKSSIDDDVTTFTVPMHLHYHKANGLMKDVKYNFWVTATTSAGEGSPSSIIGQTIENTGKQNQNFSFLLYL